MFPSRVRTNIDLSLAQLLLLAEFSIEVRAVDVAHHLAAVLNRELEGLLLTILFDGEGSALLNARFWTPADGVALMLGAVWSDLSGAGNAEFTGCVAGVGDDDTALTWLFRDSFELFVELIAILLS